MIHEIKVKTLCFQFHLEVSININSTFISIEFLIKLFFPKSSKFAETSQKPFELRRGKILTCNYVQVASARLMVGFNCIQ